MIIALLLVGMLFSCNKKNEVAELLKKLDSLNVELQTNQNTMQTLQEVGILIDSIDASRDVLRTRMLEGTSLEDYTTRLYDINNYVKDANKRIATLEDRVKSLNGSNSSFTGTLKRLKGELEKRNNELTLLQETVTQYRNENDNLKQTVNLQETEIADKLEQLKTKQLEIIKLDKDISELTSQSEMAEAETYYILASAIEETANRTHFAPRKKKETRKEALEMYRLAANRGIDKAQAKIEELEKKM
jgi:chromosome segregation ATPase